jgi:hypothetical protein
MTGRIGEERCKEALAAFAAYCQENHWRGSFHDYSVFRQAHPDLVSGRGIIRTYGTWLRAKHEALDDLTATLPTAHRNQWRYETCLASAQAFLTWAEGHGQPASIGHYIAWRKDQTDDLIPSWNTIRRTLGQGSWTRAIEVASYQEQTEPTDKR